MEPNTADRRLVACAVAAIALAAAPVQAAWEPTKPVEIVVAAGARDEGGGSGP
jgi:tripartite-type tricarboxylate transporter receptor subunit TctC